MTDEYASCYPASARLTGRDASRLYWENEELRKEIERLRECEKDAHRYRFLRDADNWPEGTDEWDDLMESTGSDFDAIIDWQMERRD